MASGLYPLSPQGGLAATLEDGTPCGMRARPIVPFLQWRRIIPVGRENDPAPTGGDLS